MERNSTRVNKQTNNKTEAESKNNQHIFGKFHLILFKMWSLFHSNIFCSISSSESFLIKAKTISITGLFQSYKATSDRF